MTNDTLLLRIDLAPVREKLAGRKEVAAADLELVLDRMVAAFHDRLETSVRDYEAGQGDF
jgi:hypothetical protein